MYFMKKLPLYDISSHTHKFDGMHKPRNAGVDHPYSDTKGAKKFSYDPPLPTSILEFKK